MLNLSYPDQVYSSQNPPSNETLKADLSLIEAGHNALETEVNALQALVMEAVYPVGSYYFNGEVDTNPATLLGLGTWVAVSDKMIVGKGSTFATLLATGGSITKNLTHNHAVSGDTGTPDLTGTMAGGAEAVALAGHKHAISFNTGSGGSETQDIMPPYEVANIWRRVS